jgi:hypothetical protein
MKRYLTGVLLVCMFSVGPAKAEEKPAGTNLAPNPGFEQPESPEGASPEGWTTFSSKINGIGVSKAAKHSGEQCMKMEAQKVPANYQGLVPSLDVPVLPGDIYTFSAYITNNNDDPLGGTAQGTLIIEWIDANKKEVARITSAPWDRNISRMRWEAVSISKAKVPNGATLARFGIHLNDGMSGGKGSVFIDDVTIEKQ